MSPETVNTSGVVGQATSFDLTLTGGSPYTYTQTFGNICDVSINNDTATVTITPVTSGTLTGSITFDNQATCNITIDVSESTPTEGFQPSTVSYTMAAQESKNFDFLFEAYDTYTERVEYSYSADSSIEESSVSVLGQNLTHGYRVSVESDNQTEQAVVGNVYATAEIYDLENPEEILRTYTATINLTIQGLEPEP